jgi:hypothetical protein
MKIKGCKTCEYWNNPPDRAGFPWDDFGACDRTPHDEDIYEWNRERTKRIVKAQYTDRTAAVMDGSGYFAKLTTKPDHYCSMWSVADED